MVPLQTQMEDQLARGGGAEKVSVKDSNALPKAAVRATPALSTCKIPASRSILLANNSSRYRHQLNHNSKQVYHCEYPGCTRTFVRGDLLKRHMDRHTAKGSQLSRRDSVLSHVSQTDGPGSASPETSRAAPGYHQQHPAAMNYHAQDTGHYAPMNSVAQGSYPNGGQMNGHQPQRIDTYGHDQMYHGSAGFDYSHSPVTPAHAAIPQRTGSLSVSSPAPGQDRFVDQAHSAPQSNYVSQSNMMSFNLPPSQYPNGQGVSQADVSQANGNATSTQYSEPHHQQSEMMMLDQMAMPGTVPVFGSDMLNKSPYVGLPEDFLSFLFNTTSPGERSPMGNPVMHGQYAR